MLRFELPCGWAIVSLLLLQSTFGAARAEGLANSSGAYHSRGAFSEPNFRACLESAAKASGDGSEALTLVFPDDQGYEDARR